MKEGRRASRNFDVDYYRSNNSDLAKAFGNNLAEYYKHYVQYGKAEGRKASAEGTGAEDTGILQTTGANGEFTIKGLPVVGISGSKLSYTVEEINVPERYTTPKKQTFTLNFDTTTTVNFENKLKESGLKLVKTSEDGIVSGLSFRITGGGQTVTKITGANGELDVTGLKSVDTSNKLITYTAEELNTPVRYLTPISQTFTLQAGKTATLNFDNKVKRANVKLVKISEDNVVEGLKFKLVGGGQTIEKTTNAKGEIDVSDLQVYDKNNVKISYTAEEMDTPVKYVAPAKQTFTLEYGKVTTIKFENKYKRSSMQLVKTSEDNVLEGLKFEITGNGQKSEKVTGKDGKFNVADMQVFDTKNAKITYTIKEIDTPVKYVQPAQQTFVLEYGKVTTVNFDNKYKRSSIQLVKTSEDGVLEGLKFEITGNGQTWTKTTGKDGKFNVADMQVFDTKNAKITYTIKEIDTPVKYVQPAVQTFTLEYGKVTTVNFDNKYKRSSMQLIKTSEDNVLEGLKFEITGNGQKWEKVTGKDGKFNVSDMQVFDTKNAKNTYTIKEIDTPVKYVQPAQQTFVLEYGKVTTVNFDNKYKRSSMQLVKTSEDDIIEGLKFEITGNGQKWEKVTGKDGKFNVSNMQVFDTKNAKITYTIKEIDTPVRYIQSAQQTFTLEYGKVTTVNFHNVLQRADLTVLKTSEDGIIEGLEFRITSSDGEIDIVRKTDEKGSIVVENLRVYDKDNVKIIYTAEEINVPDRYIKPEPQKITLNVKEENQSSGVQAKNILDNEQDQSAAIRQIAEDNPESGLGLDLNLTPLTSSENPESPDSPIDLRSLIPENPETSEQEEIPKDIVNILKFKNILIRGAVQTAKVDSENPDNKLSGTAFAVYADMDNDMEYTEETDLYIGLLAENPDTGLYMLSDLTHGDYLIHESEPPEGFVRDENYYPFKISEDGQLVEFGIVPGENFPNDPIKGTVRTTKVNADDPTDKLSGGIFDVYLDTNKDGKYSEEDTLAGTLEEIEPGVYEFEGLRYGEYLFNERTAPEGFIRDTNYYPFSITEQGQLVDFNTIPGKDFPNHPKKGTIHTTKVNADDPTDKLPGGVFDVYLDVNKDGKYTAEIDKLHGTLEEIKFGEYELTDIPANQYLFHERTAPKGFVRDENYYPFEIKEDNQLVEFESIPGKDFPNHPAPPSPQTGDNSNLILWAFIGTGSVVIFCFLTIKKRVTNKKRKEDIKSD